MRSSDPLPLLLLILACASSIRQSQAIDRGSRVVVPALFSFGDSQLDAGNNNYIVNSSARVDFPPYGETYFHRPTGRFSNGRTFADFLALSLGLPLLRPSLDPNVSSYLHGINFASGGSGLLDATSFDGGVLPMSVQLEQFHKVVENLIKELHGDRAAVKQLLSESMYIITSGSNDFGLNYMQNSTLQQAVKPQDFVASLMQQYRKTILMLREHGARKIVVFELGLLGCTPFSRLVASLRNETGCLVAANQLSMLFNQNLEQLVFDLRKQAPEVKLVLGKTFAIFSEIMSRASDYGFENVNMACCGAGRFNAEVSCGRRVPPGYPYKPYVGKKPSKFLFWDGSHPTEAAYRLVFRQLWAGNVSAIEPFNLSQLASMKL